MASRLLGALVLLVGLGGCTLIGLDQMINEQRAGGLPISGLLLLTVPLLIVGWIAVRIGRLVIGRWRHDYLDETRRERLMAGLGVAALSGGLLFGGITVLVPSSHPDAALVAALKPACGGSAVNGAGIAQPGASINHLVLLATDGSEHRWTGFAPIEWKPASLADTELVACVSADEIRTQIETCQYINGPAITRYSAARHVVLVEPGTGRTIASYDMTDTPRECRSTEERSVVELTGSVPWETVRAGLATHVGCCEPAPTAPTAGPSREPGPTPWWQHEPPTAAPAP